TNNHVEGYNKRLESNFPVHPHIYEFVRLLRDEHSFQHHQAEASEIRAPKRKKLYTDIDNKLKELLHGFATGILNEVELVIKCGRAVKTTPIKKLYLLLK
ncbi:unnamed protein product, partial [Didymodactylos carnosus]